MNHGIIYKGPSLLDGKPIVVIGTYSKRNSKTGAVLQTYILCDDGLDPLEASKTGADFSICGDCIMRGTPTTDPKRKQAAVTYQMIRSVLTEQGIVGIVTYVRWGRNHLALLDVEQNTGSLIVSNMMWPDELREASGVPDSDTDVDPRLMPVMRSLAETMTKDWMPSDYTDTYTDNLNEAIGVKASGGEIASVASGGGEAITDVSDLLAKLEASIDAKAPAKKAPAKRASRKIAS